jgi:hypothetical protein
MPNLDSPPPRLMVLSQNRYSDFALSGVLGERKSDKETGLIHKRFNFTSGWGRFLLSLFCRVAMEVVSVFNIELQ